MLMVVSGQQRSNMEDAFKSIPAATLAAEHGFYYKLGAFPGVRRLTSAEWQNLIPDMDMSWKETAMMARNHPAITAQSPRNHPIITP